MSDTPSNRYAKLQKQSQDADPNSDPGNDPDANNPQNNNQMANNSNGSNNQSRTQQGNQDAKRNGSYGGGQTSSSSNASTFMQSFGNISDMGAGTEYRVLLALGYSPNQAADIVNQGLYAWASGHPIKPGQENSWQNAGDNLVQATGGLIKGAALGGLLGELGVFGGIANALKSGLGFFRGERELIPTAESAQNIIKGVQLKEYYQNLQSISHLIENGILNFDKTLTPDAIQTSLKVLRGEDLKNSVVRNALSKIDEELENWGKFVTKPSMSDPAGRQLEMHFYKNTVTNQVYYGMDYKMVINSKIDLPIDLESEEFNFGNR